MRKALTAKDILGWDVRNWSRALRYWERHLPKEKKLECLELGANRGGISLWLAGMGHDVVCSDILPVSEEVKQYHRQFQLKGTISYAAIDAAEIPYENRFDVIVLKSVLGGVGRGGQTEKMQAAVSQIRKALRPGGVFLFAENLNGTALHKLVRESFKKWVKNNWNYLRVEEMEEILEDFSEHDYKTTGFLGAFGFYEPVRNIFGNFDGLLNGLPAGWHYIVYGSAVK